MDACSSPMFSFSGCDDYLTFSLHLECQKGNMKELKQMVLNSEYDYEKKSFYSGYTLLQAAAVHDRLYVFQWIFDCSSSSYYGLAYFGSIAGHGRAILESMKYCEGINLKILHYIATTCSPSSLHEKCASIFLACLDGNLNGVIDCLKKDLHTIPVDDFGHTALHLACLNENLGVAKHLFEIYHDKDCLNILRNTPLHLSCIQGNIDLVKYLVNERGCNLLIENINGHTPLHIACQYGNIVVVKYLIDVVKADALYQDSRGNTLLHHASHAIGDVEVAEYLVDIMHCDPFCPNNEKSTPIHLACRNGNLEVAKYLSSVAYHYQISCIDKTGRTPLHDACIHGHLNIVSHLSRENHSMHEDIYCSDYDGFTPLLLACKLGHLDTVMYLIQECKCDVSRTDDDKHTPLHLACKHGHLDIVMYLIKECKCDVSYTDHDKHTPFHLACKHGHLDIVIYLIKECKCDVSYTDHDKHTPLHLACKHGHLDIVMYLIKECKCDVSYTDDDMHTPLHLACKHGYLDIVMYLIKECKCDMSYADNDKYMPLHLACKHGLLDIVMYLIKECKCDVSYTDDDKHTPLHLACKHGHLDVVMYLIKECNCGMSYTDNDKYMPIHLACKHGHLDIVMYLIKECKCDVSCTDDDKHTPLHLACKHGHLDIVMYMIKECKCDVSYTDEDKDTSLHLACQNGHVDIINYLIDYTDCNFTSIDKDSLTPCHIACSQNYLDIAVCFMNKLNCDIHIDQSLLHIVCQNGNVALVQYLISDLKKNEGCVPRPIFQNALLKMDSYGNTPLYYAFQSKHYDIVQFLVSIIYSEILCQDFHNSIPLTLAARNDNGNTPLHIACLYGDVDDVKSSNEKLNFNPFLCKNNMGLTPLHFACVGVSFDLIKFLVTDETPSPIDYKGYTPLHYASQFSSLEVVKYLILKNKFDFLHRGLDNNTALHLAIIYDRDLVVQYFLEKNLCEGNLTGENGRTPLILAALYQSYETLKYLVDDYTKSDHSIIDDNGKTALCYIYDQDREDIINYYVDSSNYEINGRTHKDKALLYAAAEKGQIIGFKHICQSMAVNVMQDKLSHETDTNGNTALHLACMFGHLEVVQYLASEIKLNLDILNLDGQTCFHLASKYCQFVVMQYLLSISANISCKDKNGSTPLHIACQYGYLNIVELLSTTDSESELDADGRNPLHIASYYGHLQIVQSYVNNFDMNSFSKDPLGLTPLHYACIGGNQEVVQFLDTDITSATDNTGYTPLYHACKNGHLKVLQYFTLKDQSQLFYRDHNNNTLLHIAARYNQAEVVQYFLEQNWYVNLRGEDGKTPLCLAAFYQSYETLKYLIGDYSKCDHSITDDNGKTALCYIYDQDRQDIINYYVDSSNYDINGRTHKDKALLYAAAKKGQIIGFKHICQSMSNDLVNVMQDKLSHETDTNGNTALHLACIFGHLEVVQYLASEIKLNLDILNLDDQTCFHLASKHGQFLVMQYFSSINANISCKDKNGSTPLHIACQYGCLNIVKLLSTTYSESALDVDGRNPLHIASYYGQLQIVLYYVNNYKMNSFCKDLVGLAPLHYACKDDNLEVVQVLDTDIIHTTDNTGYTPLHHACKHGYLKIVRCFTLKDQSLLFYQDHNNNTALHIAARYNQTEIVQYFLEHNLYDVNLRGENGKTSLILAAFYQSYETLKYLIRDYSKCDQLITDDNGRTALCYIYDQDREDIINFYVDSSNYVINGRTHKDNALLYAAAEKGQIIGFKHICQSMANDHVNVMQDKLSHETDTNGNSALHLACMFGHLEVVQYLASEIKLNLDILNFDGQTCFHLASMYGEFLVMQYFSSMNANISCKDKDGSTPLHLACQHGYLNIVELLSTTDSESVLDSYGRNPLHIASYYGHLQIIQYYVNNFYLDSFCKDPLGLTPLHYACIGGNLEVVQFLDTDIIPAADNTGYTPLHHACVHGHLKILQYFTLKDQSQLFCRDHNNNTLLHIAARYNQTEVVQYILEQILYDGNIRGENGKTPLILAAFYQSYETLKYLIGDYSKCDHSITDDNGKTALCYVYDQDREDIINYYVDSSNYEINGRTHKDKALLYAAAENGQIIGFKHICQSMAVNVMQDKLSHETDTNGNTALHLACMFGHLEVVQYLASEIKLNLDILNLDGQTCFHLASKYGQLLVMQYFSSINANISCKDKNGSTPLHIACQYGYLNIAELLSTTDSESVLDADGRNPLHIASYYGQLQIVQWYVNDIDLDSFCEDPLGLTPLHYACIGGNLEVVQFLNTDIIPATDKTGYTPLHQACKHGHLKVVQYFALKDQSQLFCQDHNNNTPLHIAAQYNQTEVVQYFLEQNLYDFNIKGENGKTPFLIAASYNCGKTLVYLFHSSCNCDPLIEDSSGKSSLLYLYLNDRSDMVKSIIRSSKCNIACTKYESEVFLYLAAEQKHQSFKHILHSFSNKHRILYERMDNMGNTALHIASKFGCLETVRYILDEIVFPPNHHNFEDQTCLHLASKYGQLSIVKYLTKNKCDPLSVDKYGNTPLHYATQTGCLSVVKYFIEEVKVSTEIKDVLKNTPLHLASTKGYKEIVDYLVTNSSSLLLCNVDGNTPLHLACRDGHYEVFKILLTTTKYDIHSSNVLGKSIVDYAQDKPDMVQTIRGVYGVEATFIPKIFVIGFSGAGKSTLVSALQKEASFLGRYLSIPKVPPHTVGVTPVKFQSSSYGTVHFYDFAGHEEHHANHQLLFQSSYLPIVLLLVNLHMEEDDIISSIKYWVNILKNSLTSHTGIKQSATVILLASHYDQIRGNKQEKIYNLEVKIEKTLSKLEVEDIDYNRGLICLDCRKPSCHGIETLRSLIRSLCLACRAKIAIQFPFETSLICQEILNFLSKNVSFKLACTISDICEMARKERLIPDIVKSDEAMFKMCSTLGFYGKIVLLTDSIHQEESWIILNEKCVLSEFHRSMHLLQSKSEQSFSDQVACGLVSISQLHQLFPNNLDLILKYLQYSQICAEIEAESFSIIPQSLLKEHYYFFPYLTKENKPELFTLESAEEMTPLYYWQIVCHDPFTPRFLQVLLVQLTVPVPGAGDVVPPNYTVWKNGIHIRNNDTTESIIEVNNSASQLLFGIRCQKSNESSLLTRRSHLIDLILSVLTKNCPLITYEEFLFQPHNFYPIKSSAKKISLKKSAGALIEGRPTVFTYDGSQCLELAAVWCSDPVLHVDPIILKRIYLHSNDVIPPPTMEKLCMQGNIMSTWNSSDELTYKQLQERLSCYSVFLGRNIWVSINIVVININKYMSFHVLGYSRLRVKATSFM